MVLRDHSRRHVGNDRRRRRLIGGQTGIGSVARLRERVEPKNEQADDDGKRQEQADCRSIDTLTGLMTCLSASYRAYDQVVCPPRLYPVQLTLASWWIGGKSLHSRCHQYGLLQGGRVNWPIPSAGTPETPPSIPIVSIDRAVPRRRCADLRYHIAKSAHRSMAAIDLQARTRSIH